MSQDSVLKLLEKVKKPMTAREISEELGLGSVGKNLTTLKKYNEIKWVWKLVKVKSKIKGETMERPVLHYFV